VSWREELSSALSGVDASAHSSASGSRLRCDCNACTSCEENSGPNAPAIRPGKRYPSRVPWRKWRLNITQFPSGMVSDNAARPWIAFDPGYYNRLSVMLQLLKPIFFLEYASFGRFGRGRRGGWGLCIRLRLFLFLFDVELLAGMALAGQALLAL